MRLSPELEARCLALAATPAPKPAALESVAFTLPVPPSVNNLYANVPGQGRIKTKRYSQWFERCRDMAWAAGVQGQFDGPVTITVTVFGGKDFSAQRDIDNILKPVCDFVKMMGLIRDDNVTFVRQVKAIYIPKPATEPKRLAMCHVVIQKIGEGA